MYVNGLPGNISSAVDTSARQSGASNNAIWNRSMSKRFDGKDEVTAAKTKSIVRTESRLAHD